MKLRITRRPATVANGTDQTKTANTTNPSEVTNNNHQNGSPASAARDKLLGDRRITRSSSTAYGLRGRNHKSTTPPENAENAEFEKMSDESDSDYLKDDDGPGSPELDEIVDEGWFDDEVLDESELESDAPSIVSISSTEAPLNPETMSQRPWKDQNWPDSVRYQWETMYCDHHRAPVHGSWGSSEDYQRERDAEMLRYIHDFPLNMWVIEAEKADEAYARLLDRIEWRGIGQRVYGPGLGGLQTHHLMQTQRPTSGHQTRANFQNSRYTSGPGLRRSSTPAETIKDRLDTVGSQPLLGVKRKRSNPLEPVGPTQSPPYPKRAKPVRTMNVGNQGRHVDFPWNRMIDFNAAKANASWDVSKYDISILEAMTVVREKNWAYIELVDQAATRAQRENTAAKKRQNSADASDNENTTPLTTEKIQKKAEQRGIVKPRSTFSFARLQDYDKSLELGHNKPDDLINAAQVGKVDWNICKDIMIYWDADKKGETENLDKAYFRVYDTLVTLKQVDQRLIFTNGAAECIIDFCPHLLWNDTLLRLLTETDYTNSTIRARLRMNGGSLAHSTLTKRVGSIIGQKSKTRGFQSDSNEGSSSPHSGNQCADAPFTDLYRSSEEEWHALNKQDFENYKAFMHSDPSKVLKSNGPGDETGVSTKDKFRELSGGYAMEDEHEDGEDF